MRSTEAMALLGFPPYSRPSPSEVKAAYRRMVMESHPDRAPTHLKSQAELKFEIAEAYSCLKDGRRSGSRSVGQKSISTAKGSLFFSEPLSTIEEDQ